jgi:glycosyltransferase involved in cell wall biosynthesis
MEVLKNDARACDVLAIIIDVALTLENSAVFQSQVADQLLALRALGYRVGLLAVSREAQVFEQVVGRRLRDAGVELFLVPDRGFARNLLAMAASLRSVRRLRAIGMAYARGVWGPVVLALGAAWSVSYVYDVRGALADETKASGRVRLKQHVYAALERWAIRGATRVTAVTRALADVVARAHSINQVEVVPCCVDIAAVTVDPAAACSRRSELGYSATDVVLVYSGGLSHYQQVPAMLALWRRLRDEHDVKFLLLTNEDPHSVPAVVGDLGDFQGRLRHLSLPRAHVPVTLAAGDIGFMLRDARELNRVASPVKFAEYLAAGLAVVASPGTGDASELIERRQLGTLVDPAQLERDETRVRHLLQALRGEREAMRQRARALAAEHYDWQAHREAFRRLYGSPHSAV